MKLRRGLSVAFALAIATGAAVLFGQAVDIPPLVGPQTLPAASQPSIPMDPYTKDLLARLNSPDAAQRDAAQRQLANIAGLMQQPEALKKLQDITTDPDLKDFFVQRQAQIRAHEEERRLANLANITLKLTNASLAQMASELNKALGNPPMSFIVENNGGDQNTLYTIDVKDRPFWEVFAQLQEMGGFDIQNYGGNQAPRLYPANQRYPRKYIISGPVMAVATGINYQRNINFQGPNNSPASSSLSINFNFLVDPRVRATRFKYPTNIKYTDDQGQSLGTTNMGNGYNSGQSIMYSQGLSLTPPSTLPKTISVTFDSAVTTTVGDTKITVEDITKNNDKTLTLGNRTMRIVNVTGVDLAEAAPAGGGAFGGPGFGGGRAGPTGRGNASIQLEVQPIVDSSDFNSRIPFTIIDANNRVLLSSSFTYGGMNFNFATAGAQGPFKMEISSPGRNFDIPVHFEFKDLLMP